ncbi:MAG TPA: DUF4093 domain-containing protein [Candidatus Monoglobus merdigallinarum]|uniref:DUF4093 domain-containing protein n=1 Tax=Candidatus Monoglobus merdigallinarum TaxID=2838698 RepID=A0A9D1TLM6_9FIRM|nr:DUF4093 domain-containing protein [Candidatus Monoglobus merdigallinarum]
MLNIKETIIVEGKYDKQRVRRVCSAPIICTDGFRIFKSKEMLDTIKMLASTTGIIILTDSDRAGFKIRNYIKSCVGQSGTVKHAYIPAVEGKERRKERPGKEGILGVEGMDDKVIIKAIKSVATPEASSAVLSKSELFRDGLSGTAGSRVRREYVLKALSLPVRLSPNAMIELINSAGLYDKYKAALSEIKKEDENDR